MFPLLLVQMRYGLLYALWVWHSRTNCWPCCTPMSNPSTSPWTGGSGWWDNWMAAQNLPRDLVWPSSGLKNSLKRRRICYAFLADHINCQLTDVNFTLWIIWCRQMVKSCFIWLWSHRVPGFFFGHFSVIDGNSFERTKKIKSFRSECLKI